MRIGTNHKDIPSLASWNNADMLDFEELKREIATHAEKRSLRSITNFPMRIRKNVQDVPSSNPNKDGISNLRNQGKNRESRGRIRGPDANVTIMKSEQRWYVKLREIKEGIADTDLSIETPKNPRSLGPNETSMSNFEERATNSDEAGCKTRRHRSQT